MHTPQEGKELTTTYLRGGDGRARSDADLPARVVRRSSAILEFTAELDGLTLHGIDMIRWGTDGRITEFTVMVRPFKALQKLMELMLLQLVP